ncbi:MAG TPA: phosphoserine phosphatase SerB [Xanthobacteraceae bacterium]|nr:phosphoserine phosphatase SerB [Xanthobacteraceae bacterium]
MSHVATLISNPSAPALTRTVVDAARILLPVAGKPAMLAEGVACDIPFEFAANGDASALLASLRAAIEPAPIDVVIQTAARRKKKLFLADMDSTMIAQECIDELADFAGLKAHIAAITERAMKGEIDFVPALRERVALLKGLPAGVIDEVIEQRIRLTPGARALVMTMKKHGAYTCLVSGGFTLFTSRIAAMIGFDENRANRLVIENGKLAGSVEEPILGREAKLATLKELTAKLKLDPADTLVAGDGANDIPMIEAAGLGVAYHAKPAVVAAAAARIDRGDLTALLYLQGYKRKEFVE